MSEFTVAKDPIVLSYKHVNCQELKATHDLYDYYYHVYYVTKEALKKKHGVPKKERPLYELRKDNAYKIATTLANRILEMEDDLLHEYEKEVNI